MSVSFCRRFVLNQLKNTSSSSLTKRCLTTSNTEFNPKRNKYLSQQEATDIDVALMNEYGYSIEQLMELAGLSCASVVSKVYKEDIYKKKAVLVICGPGNNGGDGLVLSRHLKIFGYRPVIFYPKPSEGPLFKNLVKQCRKMDIEFINSFPVPANMPEYGVIVDALFGFGYKPPIRNEFFPILQNLSILDDRQNKLVSIDIPSGWHVETGPMHGSPAIDPDCLISLTAPKLCAKYFTGKHWIGGRFVPDSLSKRYSLFIPKYIGEDQCFRVT